VNINTRAVWSWHVVVWQIGTNCTQEPPAHILFPGVGGRKFIWNLWNITLHFTIFRQKKNIIRRWSFKSSRIWCHVDWQIVIDFLVGPVASASRSQKFQVCLMPWQISDDLNLHHCYKNYKPRMMRRNIHWSIKAGLLLLYYFQCAWDVLKITTDFTIEVLKIRSTLFIFIRAVWVADIQLCVTHYVHRRVDKGTAARANKAETIIRVIKVCWF